MARRKGFTLVEIMIVVAILGIIIAIAIPTFFRSRELSRMRSCQENQAKIDGAKENWALDTRAAPDAEPQWSELVGVAAYIRKSPACPASGTYSINAVNEDPACSRSNEASFPHEFEISPPGNT
ncbi:prepilin-type N-terminal cleavage/methylation domain-containing protein [Candidatus Sumerlaeota bacterium]|nr:prepilin-type N-terminal cleavage/methylation domain-containing protein [Candidatus Sumerlaeota bacterium]